MSLDVDVLERELARLDVLIDAEVRRMRSHYDLSVDEYRGLLITDERVDHLLSVEPKTERTVPDISSARTMDQGSRWNLLAQRLDLADDELDILLVSLAPGFDARYEALYAYLNDDVRRPWANADLVVRLLSRDPPHALRLRGLLLSSAALRTTGALIQVDEGEGGLRRRARLRGADAIVDWLLGLPYVDDRLAGWATLASDPWTLPPDAMPVSIRDTLRSVTSQIAGARGVSRFLMVASSAADAAMVAKSATGAAGRSVITVDLSATHQIESQPEAAAAVALAARLLEAAVVASPVDAVLEPGGAPAAAVQLLEAMAASPATVFFASGPDPRRRGVFGKASPTEIDIPDLNVAERTRCWSHALAHYGMQPAATIVRDVADRFSLGPERITIAAAKVLELATLQQREEPTRGDVFAAARGVSSDGAVGLTSIVNTPLTWDDLVLPPSSKGQLLDVAQAIERRNTVLDDWGFGDRFIGARGIKAMFAGPSGTGKTMAAAILARTLLLDLHRIDLGQVVSKYIGETEKNLERAFNSARQANAVLFMDEADALLGKRSQVKDAHDRYANVESSYLLQKMEDHDGIVIVATNLSQNIDEAFARRMQFVVMFPMPDVGTREELWRRMFPDRAPVDADVDFAFLARQFELSGGDIRSVVLSAAYSAGESDGVITLGHILRAIRRHLEQQGAVASVGAFREYSALLSDGVENLDVVTRRG